MLLYFFSELMRKQIETQNSLKADQLLQTNNQTANRDFDEEWFEIRMEELRSNIM